LHLFSQNQFEKAIGNLSKIADVNVVAVREDALIHLNEESKAPINLQHNNSYKTTERIKLIKHAKRLGFNSTEIRKLLVFWNK
jgi:hypothetical protein